MQQPKKPRKKPGPKKVHRDCGKAWDKHVVKWRTTKDGGIEPYWGCPSS